MGAGEDLLDAQFGDGFAEVGGLHRGLDVLGSAGKLEHAVSVAVECDGPPPAFDQPLHQGEVAAGVLLGTDHRVGRGAGGVAHRQEQGELGAVIVQPPVETTVDLHQHASLRHSLSPDPMHGRTPIAWAGDARSGENATHGGPAEVDTLPIPEQLSARWVWLAPA